MGRRFKKTTKWLGITLLTLCVLVVLFLYFGVPLVLRNAGIEFSSYNYDFPSQIELTDYDMDFGRIQAKGKYIKVNWKWTSLTSGNPTLTGLTVDNIEFYLNPKDTTLPEVENKEKKGLPDFLIKNAHLQEVKLGFVGNFDSSFYDIGSLYVNHYQMGDSIFVDSLLLTAVHSRLHFTQDKPEADPQPLPENILATMPDFYGNYVSILNSSLSLYNAQQTHQLSDVDIILNTQKSHQYGGLGLERLKLTYQDTLNIDLDIAKAGIEPNLNTTVKDIHLVLPGLKLSIDEVGIANNQGLQITTKIASSYISYGLLKSFVPTIPKDIPHDGKIDFSGTLGYHNKHVVVKDFQVSTLKHTGLEVYASANLEDMETPSFDLDIKRLYTTLDDVVLLTGKRELKKQVKVQDIAIPLTLEGDLNKFTLSCSINADNKLSVPIQLHAYKVNDDYQYKFNTTLSSVALQDIIYLPDNSLIMKGFELEAFGLFNQKAPAKKLKASLKTADLKYNQHHFSEIKLVYDNHYETDSLLIHLKERKSEVNLGATYSQNERNELNINGDILYYFPKPTKVVGDSLWYTTSIKSLIQWDSTYNKIDGYFALNNGSLNDTSTSYDLGNMVVSLTRNFNDLTASLHAGKLLDFDLKAQLADQWNDQTAPLDIVENLSTDLSMDLDSNLVLLIADVSTGLKLNAIGIDKRGEQLSINGDIEEAYFKRFVINDLKLNSSRGNKQTPFVGSLEIEKLNTPYTEFDHLFFNVKELLNGYHLNFGTYITTTKSKVDWSINILNEGDQYRLNIDQQSNIVFGKHEWNGIDFPGILFSSTFEPVKGELAIQHKNQTIGVRVVENEKKLQLVIKNLDLYPITQNFDSTITITGILGSKIEYNMAQKLVNWKTFISNISFDDNYVGNLSLDGRLAHGVVMNDLRIDHKASYLTASTWIKGTNIDYHVKAHDFDVVYLNKAPFWPEGLNLEGIIETDVKGNFGTYNTSDGFVTFKDFTYKLGANYPTYTIKEDKVIIKDYDLFLNNFNIYDEDKNEMTINGEVALMPLDYYLTINSDRFRVLKALNSEEDLKGDVNLTYDLKIIGNQHLADVSGDLKVIDGSEITYTVSNQYSYHHNKQSTVVFSDFQHDDLDKLRAQQKKDFELNLDVGVDIGKTSFKIILNEISQEYLVMYGKGNLRLKDGMENDVLVFGQFEADNGTAFIEPPIIPNMNLDIDWARVNWKGDVNTPYISFQGRQHMRASPKGLMSEYRNSTVREDFDVILKVRNSTLEDLKVTFDLSSRNGKIDEYLQSQTEETRQTYAINLLMLGTFETKYESGGGSSYLNLATNKLNEISRRNLKAVDLSFSVDNETNPYDESENATRFNYRLSKAFMNNKAYFTIGGDYGASQNHTVESDASKLAGFFELNFILSESPYIVARASRGQEYEGVIDGEVDVIKAGLSIEKSYPSFLYIFGFRNKGR